MERQDLGDRGRKDTEALEASISCPACEGTNMRGTVQVPDHEYGVDYVATFESCRDCRTEFQRPMPSGGQLSSFYPPNYHSMADGGFLRLRHEMRIRRLRALLGGAGGVVLDYGCGNGSFLQSAAAALPETEFVGDEIANTKEIVRPAARVTISRARSRISCSHCRRAGSSS
jgi:hypothetical protein